MVQKKRSRQFTAVHNYFAYYETLVIEMVIQDEQKGGLYFLKIVRKCVLIKLVLSDLSVVDWYHTRI